MKMDPGIPIETTNQNAEALPAWFMWAFPAGDQTLVSTSMVPLKSHGFHQGSMSNFKWQPKTVEANRIEQSSDL